MALIIEKIGRKNKIGNWINKDSNDSEIDRMVIHRLSNEKTITCAIERGMNLINGIDELIGNLPSQVWLYGPATSGALLSSLKYITDEHGAGNYFINEIDKTNYKSGYVSSWAAFKYNKKILTDIIQDNSIDYEDELIISGCFNIDSRKLLKEPPIYMRSELIKLFEKYPQSIYFIFERHMTSLCVFRLIENKHCLIGI